VAAFDAKNVDAVVLTRGKETVKLLHPEGQAWKVYADGGKARGGDEKAIENLLEAVQGKNAIVGFFDGKDDAWGGLKNPAAEVSVYVGGLAKDAKDAGKDAKKADKRDETPALKKDAKPVVKLEIGTTDAEVVHVRRTLQDGTVSRFTVPKAQVAKLDLDRGALAYLEKTLPPVASLDVAAIELKRGKETLDLVRTPDAKTPRWFVKDAKEPSGKKPADTAKVMNIITNVAGLAPKKWVATATGDLAKYGLKDPGVAVTLYVKKDGEVPSAGVASLLGLLGAANPPGPLPAAAVLAANRVADKGQPVTVRFGADADKGGVYATRSGVDFVFVAPADAAKLLREIDVRDRSMVLALQPLLDAGALTSRHAPLVVPSPLVTGEVHSFDPDKIKEIKLAVRTPFELRSFVFQRTGKDKDRSWKEASGLQEFQLDPDKVGQMVKDLARLRAERFVGFNGPREEQKLSPKEAALRAELSLDDGRTVTLTVGGPFERAGHFAQTTAWPGAVFLVPSATVEPWLRGVGYFSKERVAAVQ
jgi:hypothetical protein